MKPPSGPNKTNPIQTQYQNRSQMPVLRGQIICSLFSALCPLSSVFCLLPSVHGNEHKGKEQTEEFTQVLLSKIPARAAIFNPIKKLTIAWTGANLNER